MFCPVTLAGGHQGVSMSLDFPSFPILKKSKFEYEMYTFKNLA